MVVDWTITIGNIVEVSVLAIGGIGVITALRSTVGAMKTDLTDLKVEIKKLGQIMVNMTEIRGDLKALANRVSSCEQDIREMRHGHGYVIPRSEGGINGEWP